MSRKERITCTRALAAAALWVCSTITVAAGPGWTQNSMVSKLVVTGDGGVNVLLSPPPTGCLSNAGYGPEFASIYPNHPGIKQMKADLLTAYVTGRPVALYFTDSTCRVGEMMLGGW